MLPLLGGRSQSINVNPDVKKRKISLDEAFDRYTFIVNFIRHLYNIFLMYYFWNKGNHDSDNQIDIGQSLLIIYCCLGIVIAFLGFGTGEAINKNYLDYNGLIRIAYYFFIAALLSLQPLFLAFLYIFHLDQKQRDYFYFNIFINILFNGIGTAMALFYYLVSHPAQLFIPSALDQFIMMIYLILFAASIVSIYPLFMPLNSINTKHLSFKLCAILLNITRMLFVGFLFVSYYSSIISVHPTVEYIYDIYLIQFFEITPILCIWTLFYTINFHYFETIGEMIHSLMRFSLFKKIFCGLCSIGLIIIMAMGGLPGYILCVCVIAGIYWWIFYQCFVFNIMDSFIFVNTAGLVHNEMNEHPNKQMIEAWKAIYLYLNDINDSIGYQQRLCILKVLSGNHLGQMNDDLSDENLKNIILNHNVNIAPYSVDRKYGFIVFFVGRFLQQLMIYSESIFGLEQKRDDFGLLHFYDFDTGTFKFKCKHWVYIAWELCGLFVILPIFILSTICVSIILPLMLLVMYFYVFITQHSFTYLEFVIDFKLWILLVYIVLLFCMVYLWIDQQKLVRIWYDCQCIGIENFSRMNTRNVMLYHNSIHEHKMIHAMLNTFFGELSTIIMEYIGMKVNDELHIPSLVECMKQNEGVEIIHRNTIVCNQYLFDIESDTY